MVDSLRLIHPTDYGLNEMVFSIYDIVVIASAIGLVIYKLGQRRARAARGKKYWFFYAGPESYLDKSGEIDFRGGRWFWSCEPETREGDFILLYRKSINQLTVDNLMRQLNMSESVAKDLKVRKAGKDIAAIWQAVSNSKRQSSWRWSHGCDVVELQKLEPPIGLEELKANPQLKAWESLRRNFRAEGHSALEIPPSVWKTILQMIESKCGLKPEQFV